MSRVRKPFLVATYNISGYFGGFRDFKDIWVILVILELF
jgi:hypothetical protein